MILKQFFDYYFNNIDSDVLNIYSKLLPNATDLSSAYAEMFSRNDEKSISFLLDFHKVTTELKQVWTEQAILFNVSNNICFPFYVKYIWEVMSQDDKKKVQYKLNCANIDKIIDIFQHDVSLRNWFREEIGSFLSQEELFALNEIIALQNFSSGGEYSFLKFVYPKIKNLKGRVLDAGCGAGFASIVMSQYLSVYSIDACSTRLERARALFKIMKKGERKTFSKAIDLIAEELGRLSVYCEIPTVNELLSKESYKVNFIQGSIENLPYENEFFDIVNCLDVLEHTYNPEKVLKEFSRVLKPGGKIFITVPTRYGEVEQRIWENIEGTMFPAMLHMHHFNPKALNEIFEAKGFKEEQIIPFDFMNWNKFSEIADKSPAKELADELRVVPFDKVALQIFAVYEKE
ncbi:hypothetical protein SYNTR_0655 [Candidatus Syntrophocurvum alkaliphilum]|uniref:Methyltransferase type 11 domain-containing protein n=1 Tax=Candidatus Syntrophocurvum alkaliphilum TaxID=2293317 RepID=A0A6I6DFN8_9FIRM|nr:class I SAM-dependent methyltransferase [Candidatus Syntrophocurvum alkaliphilum]QGT99248.1 hypothetical protein SYNTR_0655 [Candidatus Syntrophocurvum alkaliphilum]